MGWSMSRLIRASLHVLAASFLWAAGAAILRNLYLVVRSGSDIAGLVWFPAGWMSGAILLLVHLTTVGVALALSYNFLVRIVPTPKPQNRTRFIGGILVADPRRIQEAYGLMPREALERQRQARRHLILVVLAMVLVVVVLQYVFIAIAAEIGARTYDFAVDFLIPFIMALMALLGFASMSVAWARWSAQLQSA